MPGAGDLGPPSSSPAGAGDREMMDVNGDALAEMPELMVSSVHATH